MNTEIVQHKPNFFRITDANSLKYFQKSYRVLNQSYAEFIKGKCTDRELYATII